MRKLECFFLLPTFETDEKISSYEASSCLQIMSAVALLYNYSAARGNGQPVIYSHQRKHIFFAQYSKGWNN